jgi:hypothetical protein
LGHERRRSERERQRNGNAVQSAVTVGRSVGRRTGRVNLSRSGAASSGSPQRRRKRRWESPESPVLVSVVRRDREILAGLRPSLGESEIVRISSARQFRRVVPVFANIRRRSFCDPRKEWMQRSGAQGAGAGTDSGPGSGVSCPRG